MNIDVKGILGSDVFPSTKIVACSARTVYNEGKCDSLLQKRRKGAEHEIRHTLYKW